MTARERQRRRRRRGKDPSRFVLLIGGGVLAALVIGAVATVAIVSAIAKDIPPLSRLKITTYGQASTVYDAEGHVLGVIKGTILRQPIPSGQQPVFVRERHGVEVTSADATRALRAEMAHYRANCIRAADAGSLAALRLECAASEPASAA